MNISVPLNTANKWILLLGTTLFLSCLLLDDVYFWYFYNKPVTFLLTIITFVLCNALINSKRKNKGFEYNNTLLKDSIRFSLYLALSLYVFVIIEPKIFPKTQEIVQKEVLFKKHQKTQGKGYSISFYSEYGRFDVNTKIEWLYDIKSTGSIVLFKSRFKTYNKFYFCDKKIKNCFLLNK